MRRTKILWKVFLTRFEEAFEQHKSHRLTGEAAGELLGMSGRNFRRLFVRYEEDGIAGLRDRRLGRESPQRVQKSVGGIRRNVNLASDLDKRAHNKNIAFDLMLCILQKNVDVTFLRSRVGDLPEFSELLDRLYDGRLADRNRSMVILANCP